MSEGAFYGPPMQYFPCGINVVRINNNNCLVLIWNALSISSNVYVVFAISDIREYQGGLTDNTIYY